VKLSSQGVVVAGVTKRFEDVTAVDDVTLEIAAGEFFSLLGPSGCGKTTSLRMIAGFERPDLGTILIGGTDVTEIPPNRRPVNTVFQSYALFPHLTVEQNVAFGLRFKDVPKDEGRRRVSEVLELVRLHGLERRRPHQLSGGQQQRVALARALVLSPSVLLLDEPLGALDAKLRRDLQIELKSIQREIGITFVYVTHDQEEALTMSDRLAVMSGGRVEQLGSPREVYEHPQTAFVADFLGVSNLMRGHVIDGETVEVGGVRLRAAGGGGGEHSPGVVRLTIRPERVRITPPGAAGENCVAATIERFVYLGSTTQVFVILPGGDRVQALVANSGDVDEYDVGAAVTAQLPPEALRILADDEVAA
jgi:spermidine/putrescine transport system ATP-binding protein